MQVIGLCRFSYPAVGGFQIEHDDIDARIAYLYSESRMEERFRLFETVALPCLKAQSDSDFTFVVVIGESLPARHRERLNDLLAGMRQAQITAQPPRRHRGVMQRILNAARDDESAPCLQFRHDDDDAVSVDFVEKLRDAVGRSAALLEGQPRMAFDFNRGYIAELGPEGIAATEVWRSFNTAALAMYVAGGRDSSIMNFAHNKLPQHMRALCLHDDAMFVRTHNAHNDSRQKPGVKPVEVASLTPDEEAIFERRFAISADAVRRAFAR